MPQAATLPTHSHTPRRTRDTREPVRTAHLHSAAGRASIEERTAILETRWEETVPTLATSKDISDLRSELIKWGVGAVLALAAVFFGMLAANTARIDRLDSKIDSRIDGIDSRIDGAIAELKADNRETNSRIDKLDAKLDARFEAMMAEIRALRRAE